MRVFYVISPADETLQAYLDGIRFIANPHEKDCAHVTLRGPYRQRYSMNALNRDIEGADVEVTGVNTFWDENGTRQNTIYFSCASEQLRRVWHKPDYSGFHPHLTIYDGASRALARSILGVLQRYSWRLQFAATGLMALISSRGQMSLKLRANLNLALLSQSIGEPLTLRRIEGLDQNTRILYIDQLCQHLVSHAQNPSKSDPAITAS